ncbi:hypothetical protein LSAT2_005389 [Lamellibrachia satsuma]|nr:hypothetical protein LSAT2_005389 [Lamellibrachia satsuma]
MAEVYINFIVESSSPIAIIVDKIKRETLQDTVLQQVAEAIHTGKWHKLLINATPTYTPFRVYDKLENENRDIVLRGNRIVMPQTLRAKVIDLAHKGYQRLLKSKNQLRTKTWFPKPRSKDIETANARHGIDIDIRKTYWDAAADQGTAETTFM